MNTQSPTGVDKALSLEATYYSAPIPRNLGVLTILGAIFDRVYFPGVCMPMSGFDQDELDIEIARIEALNDTHQHTPLLLGMLNFVRHASVLDGFCIFTGDRDNPFSKDVPQHMVEDIHEAMHGPNPPNWHPIFETNYHKSMPGSDEHVTYPGDYHYLAGALLHSTKTGIPLLSDVPGIPIPGIEQNSPKNDAESLAAILAIECATIALPELPILRPEDLMEFRAENTNTLRAFRRSMLRYAGDFNTIIRDLKTEEVEAATSFFVKTEIVPALDELRSAINSPATSWYRRAINFGRVVPELVTSFITLDPTTAVGKVLTTYAGQFFTGLTAKGDQREALKKSGLYYLLRLQAFQSDRQHEQPDSR